MVKVTAKICGSEFYTMVKTPAEAYERVKSILNDKGSDNFEILSDYMQTIIDLYSGKILKFENNYMRLEDMRSEE